MTDPITFEHPLNERCRTLLRLSHLFDQLAFHTPRQSDWDTRAALAALRPQILVTTNTGCALHLTAGTEEAGLGIEVLHPVELLARQLR